MAETITETYQLQLEAFSTEVNRQASRSRMLSWIRLLTFIFTLVALFTWIQSGFSSMSSILVSGFFLFLFIFLIRESQRVRTKQRRAQILARINQAELNTLSGDASGWEPGDRFLTSNTLGDDLDLFGVFGLFPRLSRSGTSYGQELVAAWMLHPLLNDEDIRNRQFAVKELVPSLEFRQKFLMQALWEEPRTFEFKELERWINQPSFLPGYWKFLAWAWPFVMATGVAVAILSGSWSYLILLIILALGIVGYYQKKIMVLHEAISGYSRQFHNAALLLQQIASSSFEHELLVRLQTNAADGIQGLHRLGQLAHALDNRLNGIAFILTNGGWLQDIHTVIGVEKWKIAYKDRWQTWFTSIAQFEALNSLATWAYNHPEGTWPVPTRKPHWEWIAMAHPLLPARSRVANDLTIDESTRTVLITGSNMAGKSTFLRTVGINLLLAQMGTKVQADRWIWQPRRLFSSLRVSDSLAESTSFFMAELKKLKLILDELESGMPAVVLLDEVLKGTNSQDKQYGAEQLVERLLKLPALTFLASHITELGMLAERHPGWVENYCFESNIENGSLEFDYRLRKGIAKNKNATFLMQKMGIIRAE
ncbi:MAG: hypothetical protein R2806_22385 [Saprospiraceae bacterium]